jgi:dTDP-4-dehydrorhamnose reductase
VTRPRWLVTGAGGQLGGSLLEYLVRIGASALGVVSPRGPAPSVGTTVRLDVTDASGLADLVGSVRPGVVVHAAAIASVATAHAEPDLAKRVNTDATAALAGLCAGVGARFVYVSTDMVFDGEAAPYAETDMAAPLSVYGRSKREGERAVEARGPALVVRLPLLYGVPLVPRSTTFVEQVRALREGRALTLFHDEWRTPLALEDAAAALARAAESDLVGTLHAGGPERLSRLEMGERLAAALGIRDPFIVAASRLDVPASEPRARDLSLDTTKFETAFGVPAGRRMEEALGAMSFS